MKKVVLASLLAVAGAAPLAYSCLAQAPAQAQGGGQIQMSPEEYKAYNDANTAATPAAKAAGFEAYLKAYPNSAVKGTALEQLLLAYSQTNDPAKTLDAADRLLQVQPNNLRALTFEVYLRRQDADKLTDPAAKSAALDKVAGYAQTGLGATKPADMADADFAALKKAASPTFQSAIADDALAKKDNAAAIAALKAEISANPDDTTKPSPVLQDVYVLAQAYYTSTPPDYLNCTWYAARSAAFAPEPFKTEINKLGSYCYTKYHGNHEGYEKVQAAVQTSLDPPANFSSTVTPAPKPADIVANLIATTPDLSTLAVSDREFVLQYGNQPDPKCASATGASTTDASAATPTTAAPATASGTACPTNADKAFNSVKGKSVEFPDVQVVSATADKVMVAVSDDAVQSKTPDFEFDIKEPLKTIPAAGSKVTLTGTYASYTSSPLLIVMSDGAVVEKKKPAPARTPARRPAARRR